MESPQTARNGATLPYSYSPWSNRTPENRRCHADSKCMISDLMALNQPLTGYQHGRSKIDNRKWVQQFPIRPEGLLPNPKPDRCCTQNKSSKKHISVIGHLITHNEICGFAQFVSQCFDGQSSVAFRHFSLKKSLRFLADSCRMMRGLNIGPCQVTVSILPVVFLLFSFYLMSSCFQHSDSRRNNCRLFQSE